MEDWNFLKICFLIAILGLATVNIYYQIKEIKKDLKDIKKMKGKNKDV